MGSGASGDGSLIILHGAAVLEDPHPIWSNLTTHDKNKFPRAERFLGLKIAGPSEGPLLVLIGAFSCRLRPESPLISRNTLTS